MDSSNLYSNYANNISSMEYSDMKSQVSKSTKHTVASKLSRHASNTPSRKRKTIEETYGNKSVKYSDRYIPHRGAMDMDNTDYTVFESINCNQTSLTANSIEQNDDEDENVKSPNTKAYNNMLQQQLTKPAERILKFSQPPKIPNNQLRPIEKVSSLVNKPKSKDFRYVSNTPVRILDAPGVVDDYYLNLVDWGANNVLAVALSNTVYLWNAESGTIAEVFNTASEDDFITSVKFSNDDFDTLAIGTNFSNTLLYRIEQNKVLRRFTGHSDRVSCLDWNEHILTTGSRDSLVINNDVRVQKHIVATFKGHDQEVCNVVWNRNDNTGSSGMSTTLATGSNDNYVCVYDARSSGSSVDISNSTNTVIKPKHKLVGHTAAVKALAWSPVYSNILASGGGTTDRTIKYWNTQNGKLISSTNTGSQVSSIIFNPFENEVLSSHGGDDNHLTLWNYPNMTRCKDLTGHTGRILKTVLSPCGTKVCSVGADETLRFWNVFQNTNKIKAEEKKKLTPQYVKMKIR